MGNTITGVSAIKGYFGTDKAVETKELMQLKKADPKGYQEMAEECAKALGKELVKGK